MSVSVAAQAVDFGLEQLPKLCLSGFGFGFYSVGSCGDYGFDRDCDCDCALACVFDLGCDYGFSL